MTAKSTRQGKAGKRKTQSQRREETRNKVLRSATKIFGSKGYENTSLEDIAQKAGLTITPIYHYFGNKLTLFEAVTEVLEDQLVERFEQIESNSTADRLSKAWDAFMEQCKVPGFVQIVLIDAPHFLGRERFQKTVVVEKALETLETELGTDSFEFESPLDKELIVRILMATLTEAALMVGHNPGYDGSRIIRTIIGLLPS